MQTVTNILTTNKLRANKLVLGFVGIAAATVIGTAGLAAAQTPSQGHGYGGSTTTVNTTVNISPSGGDNVIKVVFNYFFG